MTLLMWLARENNWHCRSYPSSQRRIIDFVNVVLLERIIDKDEWHCSQWSSKIVECLTLILGMGVACSVEIGISKRKVEHECYYNWATPNSKKLLGTNVHKQRLQAIGKFCLSWSML